MNDYWVRGIQRIGNPPQYDRCFNRNRAALDLGRPAFLRVIMSITRKWACLSIFVYAVKWQRCSD